MPRAKRDMMRSTTGGRASMNCSVVSLQTPETPSILAHMHPANSLLELTHALC